MRWIVERYTYGPDQWKVDNLVYNWDRSQILVDEDIKRQVELGLIDQKNVPEEAFVPATIVTIPGSNTGVSAITYIVEDVIEVAESDSPLDAYQAVFLN